MQKNLRIRMPAGPQPSHLLDLRALVLLTLATLAGLAAASAPSVAAGIGLGLATVHCLHRLVR
jgi:hypothetical protein